ncbi:MAG: HAMP domain-containing sensor histidine kinase [Eubacteriales bacterium]|nr:HAMP domain-containing sensor histidine kinase [Eubacteriales bacterium]
MKNRGVLLLIALFAALQLLAGALCGGKEEKLDMTVVNEVVQSALAQWDDLQDGADFEAPLRAQGVAYTILDEDGQALYSSRDAEAEALKEGGSEKGRTALTLHEAIAARDTIVDLDAQMPSKGKVIFHNDLSGLRKRERMNLFFLFLGISFAELALGVGYYCYIRRKIFLPFYKLRDFAVRVAGGDLDFPLQMDRENVFGPFTESFDLMREELKAARIKEQEADRSKKELVAKLSHDIKTPVASIQAVSELMEATAQDAGEREKLAVIRKKAEQIDGMISDLFHATLEELQELSVTTAEYGSDRLCSMLGAADYLKRALIPEAPACMLVFDPLRLQQVFDNIFSNSYKYADTQIRVSFAFTEDALKIEIGDFGPGVSEEELPRLTQKYYRGAGAQKKSGAGLGLYIADYLISRMGGRLLCRNTENGFCTEIFLKLA